MYSQAYCVATKTGNFIHATNTQMATPCEINTHLHESASRRAIHKSVSRRALHKSASRRALHKSASKQTLYKSASRRALYKSASRQASTIQHVITLKQINKQ